MEIVTKSTITCPKCSYQKEEAMPTDACQYFYECKNCKTILNRSKVTVVFCSYGIVPCPDSKWQKLL